MDCLNRKENPYFEMFIGRMLQNLELYQYVLKTTLGIFIKTKYARNNKFTNYFYFTKTCVQINYSFMVHITEEIQMYNVENMPTKTLNVNTYINNMRYSFKQIQKFAKSVIRHSTLSPEVVVISWDELVEWHPTLRVVFQEVHHFQGKLLCSLYLFWALI